MGRLYEKRCTYILSTSKSETGGVLNSDLKKRQAYNQIEHPEGLEDLQGGDHGLQQIQQQVSVREPRD